MVLETGSVAACGEEAAGGGRGLWGRAGLAMSPFCSWTLSPQCGRSVVPGAGPDALSSIQCSTDYMLSSVNGTCQ